MPEIRSHWSEQSAPRGVSKEASWPQVSWDWGLGTLLPVALSLGRPCPVVDQGILGCWEPLRQLGSRGALAQDLCEPPTLTTQAVRAYPPTSRGLWENSGAL